MVQLKVFNLKYNSILFVQNLIPICCVFPTAFGESIANGSYFLTSSNKTKKHKYPRIKVIAKF